MVMDGIVNGYSDPFVSIRGEGTTSRKTLVSLTKKIRRMDPVIFYQSGNEYFAGRRFYWQSQSGNFLMAGLGITEKIKVDGESARMQQVRDRWSELTKTAVRTGVIDQEGTGPALFGGFSFDPEKESDDLWQNFGSGVFYLPAFLLTVSGGQTYLTINQYALPGESLETTVNQMEEQADEILSGYRPDEHTSSEAEWLELEKQDPKKWIKLVNLTVEKLNAGKLDKAVLSRTLKLISDRHTEIGAVLRRLQKQQEGNFIFSLEAGNDCFIGASPELLARKENKKLFSSCLAGSIERGRDWEEDEKLGNELLRDRKNLLEHRYVVSTVKSALQVICENLNIPDQPVLMKNKHIQHLYTPVEGTCADGITLFDIVARLHPTPALGGFPRDEAIKWIRENECFNRGLYASPIGWVDSDGNGEFAVGIRSALVSDQEATLFAGCGIVKDSVAEKEYEETAIKFRPMLDGLGGSGHGSR